MKRKIDEIDCNGQRAPELKHAKPGPDLNVSSCFRENLLDKGATDKMRTEYAKSKPYRHGVIANLVDPELLRNVRNEIRENVSFAPKETDIYSIHQSGDLANLDNLDDKSLALLPSLKHLRDALYSPQFRKYLSTVTGTPPLSGRKTDMAINVYTPGCHLLCHDDVIGSRRISYILYLTDPDEPWQAEWGGALRLYPTDECLDSQGKSTYVPRAEHSKSIPPAFNQLSFFAVQPGQSFHDVEEVYAPSNGLQSASDISQKGSQQRIRMAISGWYHIPQDGEEGYVPGEEQETIKTSSRAQLQSSNDIHDLPQANVQMCDHEDESNATDEDGFSEEELDFLLQFISPTYLTPDTLESVAGLFEEESSVVLDNFLCEKFADPLKRNIVSIETDAAMSKHWQVARPPHKHRYLFTQGGDQDKSPTSLHPHTIEHLTQNLFNSKPFRKWLRIVSEAQITSQDVLGRRFRHGHDYTLASCYDQEDPRVEVCLSLTPSSGWPADGEDQTSSSDDDVVRGDDKQDSRQEDMAESKVQNTEMDVGGHLIYMAGDDDDDEDDDDDDEVDDDDDYDDDEINDKMRNDPGKELGGDDHLATRKSTNGTNGVESSEPQVSKHHQPQARPSTTSSTKPNTKSKGSKINDPAIYQSSRTDDDSILFSMPPSWNKLAIVLRDKGTMRFVKYTSRQAPGDRWDIMAEYGARFVDSAEDEEAT